MNAIDFEFPIMFYLHDSVIIQKCYCLMLKLLVLGMLATIQSPSQLETYLLNLLASQSCKISDLNSFSCFFFFFLFVILTVKIMLLNHFNVVVCISQLTLAQFQFFKFFFWVDVDSIY